MVVLKQLTGLDLTKCLKITLEGLDHFADNMPQLKSLNLSLCTQLGDESMKSVAKLANLKALYLDGCSGISISGLVAVSGLEHLCKGSVPLVATVPRNANREDGNFARNLATRSQLSLLTKPDVVDGYTQSTGILGPLLDCHLKSMVVLKQLTGLDLTNCRKITDEGLKHVAELTQLASINLSNCSQITDTGLRHLGKLRQLRLLNVDHCPRITDAGRAQVPCLAS